jgi:hypothetical protein
MPIRPCNEDAGANLRGDPLQLPAGIAAFMGHLFGGTYAGRDSHATTSATRDKASARSALCVPKTLSELMEQWNRLSWRNDQAALFRSGRPGLAIQVEVAA